MNVVAVIVAVLAVLLAVVAFTVQVFVKQHFSKFV